MNAPRVVGGTAVLVLGAFWAILVLDTLGSVGFIVIVVAPFVACLAVGAYGILNGLSSPSPQARGGSSRAGRSLGPLGITVLQLLAQGKSQQEIAAATSVSASVITEKVEALTKGGYLSENALSEKGFEFLRSAA